MKLRNREVVRRFVRGDTDHDGHGAVQSRGDSLYSYRAKIATRENGHIKVFDGWDGYSTTTSKHFKFLHSELESQGVDYVSTHEPDKGNGVKDRWK